MLRVSLEQWLLVSGREVAGTQAHRVRFPRSRRWQAARGGRKLRSEFDHFGLVTMRLLTLACMDLGVPPYHEPSRLSNAYCAQAGDDRPLGLSLRRMCGAGAADGCGRIYAWVCDVACVHCRDEASTWCSRST
uniref:Uncharacterized protein n=1 Tax=Haptolina brevifila TaxID=156173 RepID=A0A7S2CMI3_9EUKA